MKTFKNYISLLGFLVSLVCVPFGMSYANTRSAEQALHDTAITTSIVSEYVKSPILKKTNLHVATHNGVVSISGKVKTEIQYSKAITLAESTKGVIDTNASRLRVTTDPHPLTDVAITAKVKGRLLKAKLLSNAEIEYMPFNIETSNAVVYITGKAKSDAVKENILSIVRGTKGVKNVKYDIYVQS